MSIQWLDVLERMKFNLVSMVHNCFHHKVPRFLMDYCIPIENIFVLSGVLPRCASTQSQLA